MKVRDKFSGGGTMNNKKKKTKDPLVEKYKRGQHRKKQQSNYAHSSTKSNVKHKGVR